MLNPRITLEQWQALVAVVEAGSHAKAAEVLHKTQSTVTYAVQKIESLLGVKAFQIEGRKAVLTPTGQLLYRRARVLLEEASGAEAAARLVAAGWEAEIRVAMDHLFPNRIMFECLGRLGVESPHTRVELFESVLGGTAEALTRGEVDIAIASHVPPGFMSESLLRMRLMPVAKPDHPLHDLNRAVTAGDLRAHRQLVVRESSSTRSTQISVEATQRWTVSNMTTSIDAARRGYGYAWAPEEKIMDELASGTLKPLPLREGRERQAELFLVIAARDAAGPGVLRLADLIRATTQRTCTAEQAKAKKTKKAAA